MLETIKNYVENLPDNKAHAVEMRMSLAGECPRRLEYDKAVGPAPITLQSYLRMESGRKIHEVMTEIFRGAYGDKFHSVDKDISYTVAGKAIPGHPDGVLEQSLPTVVEFKSCSDHTYQMISGENKPLDQHIEQAALYGVAMGLQWATIVYLNRQSCELMVFSFTDLKSIVDAIIPRIERVLKNWETNTIGPRPHHDKTESPCWFCGHKELCYEGFKSEISGAGVATLDDALLYAKTREAWANRTSRLLAEKMEATLKSELGALIYGQHKLKQVTLSGTPSYYVELKAGTKDNLLVTIKEEKA